MTSWKHCIEDLAGSGLRPVRAVSVHDLLNRRFVRVIARQQTFGVTGHPLAVDSFEICGLVVERAAVELRSLSTTEAWRLSFCYHTTNALQTLNFVSVQFDGWFTQVTHHRCQATPFQPTAAGTLVNFVARGKMWLAEAFEVRNEFQTLSRGKATCGV